MKDFHNFKNGKLDLINTKQFKTKNTATSDDHDRKESRENKMVNLT